MTVIEQFIQQYNKEYDFYKNLSHMIASQIEEQLFQRGIKAIVSHRAKKPDRLIEKLEKRNIEKKYSDISEIYDDIVDLAGIRISLYFPSEREVIDEVIRDIFEVVKFKKFPDQEHKPKYEKRFSGYWATHYRVHQKKESAEKRFIETIAEIQVASVLMHAWSEVEHDLVYKPFSGELSKEELSILDEINGLVLSGEIALERLHSAMAIRTNTKNEINDKYELTNFLLHTVPKENLNTSKLGDTYYLNNYLKVNENLKVSELKKLIKKLDYNISDNISDQLLDMLIVNSDQSINNLKKYFKNLHVPESKLTNFESFVKCWIILEKALMQIYKQENMPIKNHLPLNFETLHNSKILNSREDIYELKRLRNLRNKLFHGVDAPDENELCNDYEDLKRITLLVLDKINEEEVRNSLKIQLNDLR